MTPIERTLRDIAEAQKEWRKPRLCVGCKHYVVKYKERVCHGQISLVTGERRENDPHKAREGIFAEDMCGRQGKWFEPKDSTP